MENTSIQKLEKAQESNKITPFTKKAINILLAAFNDWPNQIISLEDFATDVEAFIGGDATKQTIKATLIRMDYSIDAWKAESLTQIMELLELYNNEISLKEIIGKLA